MKSITRNQTNTFNRVHYIGKKEFRFSIVPCDGRRLSRFNKVFMRTFLNSEIVNPNTSRISILLDDAILLKSCIKIGDFSRLKNTAPALHKAFRDLFVELRKEYKCDRAMNGRRCIPFVISISSPEIGFFYEKGFNYFDFFTK